MTQMLELLDKGFKTVVKTLLDEAEKNKVAMNEKVKKLIGEIEYINKNQVEIGWKNKIPEIKNLLDGLNSRMEVKKERIGELEDNQ